MLNWLHLSLAWEEPTPLHTHLRVDQSLAPGIEDSNDPSMGDLVLLLKGKLAPCTCKSWSHSSPQKWESWIHPSPELSVPSNLDLPTQRLPRHTSRTLSCHSLTSTPSMACWNPELLLQLHDLEKLQGI